MRKLLTAGIAAVAVVLGSVGQADAQVWGPSPRTAAFPQMNPPGWYTNTYSFAWQYPWFAYYNYSHGPYANWMSGGGYAWYSTSGMGYPMPMPPGMLPPPTPAPKDPPMKPPESGEMTIHLPADAKLLFNGTAAIGAGATRRFATPTLEPGREYAYDLSAEVVRDGRVQTVTERVIVRAGEKTRVTLTPGGIATAGAK